ncbi:MAG: hypothetical protein H5T66_11180, partial [Chloroflexi bacterium]|nr:hypothetical protein [Chloroflexota bacterium]
MSLSNPLRTPPRYAVVVVNTALRRQVTIPTEGKADLEDEAFRTRAFHYAIPQALQGEIALGQLVWVPFGPRFLQGVVVRFDEASPVAETRDILQIVDREPILTQPLLALAYWMSETYLAPIHQVIFGMVPPGLTSHTITLVQLIPDAQPEGATP